jgi:hypothetical protein
MGEEGKRETGRVGRIKMIIKMMMMMTSQERTF